MAAIQPHGAVGKVDGIVSNFSSPAGAETVIAKLPVVDVLVNKARTMDFKANDVGYVPAMAGHYIENTGDRNRVVSQIIFRVDFSRGAPTGLVYVTHRIKIRRPERSSGGDGYLYAVNRWRNGRLLLASCVINDMGISPTQATELNLVNWRAMLTDFRGPGRMGSPGS